MNYVDTHCHLDGEEFAADLPEVVERARMAGCQRILVPSIDEHSVQTVSAVCAAYPGFCYPMYGLHPEEVRADWRAVLERLRPLVFDQVDTLCAIGEVGLDFYWSREFEAEQLSAFEEQVRWSVKTCLPLMIHCRKAQNEMVNILCRYGIDLSGGVFHCFTGNAIEAKQLLQFPGFVLGIGGVLTFKKSRLAETLVGDDPRHPNVPLHRIVLETDAPYMAPVPMRGQRNEPAFVPHIISRLAEAYCVSEEEVCHVTNETVRNVFPVVSQ